MLILYRIPRRPVSSVDFRYFAIAIKNYVISSINLNVLGTKFHILLKQGIVWNTGTFLNGLVLESLSQCSVPINRFFEHFSK